MRKTAILPLAVLLGAGAGAEADGMLDPSFGNGGLVTTNFPGPFSFDAAHSLVVLPDGRAVAVGSVGDLDALAMGAARYLPSGAFDTTFSTDGLVAVWACGTAFGAGNGGQAGLLQPDGRLVMVGTCPGLFQAFWIARLNVDGSLDASFGAGGHVVTPFPDGALASAGLLQPDGRIVAVGYGGTAGGPVALKAARYNPDGSLDSTFGAAGQVTLTLADHFTAQGAALQSDGRLVIGGTYGSGAAQDFGIVRLLPNGAPDPAFDGDGLVTSNFGLAEEGESVIVLGDGRLILGGGRAFDLALARYLPDGSLDSTFGTGGLATADSGTKDTLGQLILLPNGKLLVAGSTLDSSSQASPVDFLLARFHPDGALDTSFGSSGFIQTDFSAGSNDGCRAVTVAGPDLVLTAGFTIQDADFALARYIATIPVELLTFEVE